MRIAVTGTTGRVGKALADYFSRRHQVISLPRSCCDLSCEKSLGRALGDLQCDVFINPAALTSLETCENDPVLAHRVNAHAPAEISIWAESQGVRVIHFSTDYVFEGSEAGKRLETDPVRPLSVYGRSKYEGEQAVLTHARNTVIRVSWVFGAERISFVDHIFNDALAGRPLAAVADKFSLPTYTADLALWVDCILSQEISGVVHACQSGPPASWHDIASAVVEEMSQCGILKSAPPVERLCLMDMASFRAPRPRFTAMNTERLSGHLGVSPRDWRAAIAEYILTKSHRDGGNDTRAVTGK